jgi:hypothetical protein
MTDHITDLIDLYLDGEIGLRVAEEIDLHLAGCEDCTRELSQRRRLSALIRSQPGMKSRKTNREFTAEVMARINHGSKTSKEKGNELEIAWLIVPVLLVAGLAFLQTVWVQSSLVSFVPPISEILDPSQILLPFSFAIPSAFNQVIRLLPGSNFWSWNWVSTGILAITLGILYISWLAGWWVKNQNHANA